MEKELYGKKITIQQNEEGFYISDEPEKAKFKVTAQDMNLLTYSTSDELERYLKNPNEPWGRHEKYSDLKAFVKTFSEKIQDDRAVFLDTTGVRNAIWALKGRLSPVNLLDLSTLTYSLVLYDTIVSFPIPECQVLNSDAGLKFIPLTMQDDLLQGDVWSLWGESKRLIQENISSFEQSWSQLLGKKKSVIQVDTIDDYQDSPAGGWDGLVASHYVMGEEKALQGLESESLSEYLGIQTMRVVYNQHLSEFLGIPYLATSFRTPVHATMLGLSGTHSEVVDEIMNLIAVTEPEKKSQIGPLLHFRLPFLLGTVLKDIQSLDDYWLSVAKLRQRFEALRQKLRDDRHEYEARPISYRDHFKKALDRSLKETLDTGIDAAGAGISAAGAAGIISKGISAFLPLGIKLLKIINPSQYLYRQYLKYCRPDVYILVEVADEAKALDAATPKIKCLWKSTFRGNEQRLLQTLTKSQWVRSFRLGSD